VSIAAKGSFDLSESGSYAYPELKANASAVSDSSISVRWNLTWRGA
jgi:hypothetical protein